MSALTVKIIQNSFLKLCSGAAAPSATTMITRTYAARKGTREKARKKKVKVEIKKVGFIPHNQRGKAQLDLLRKSKRIDDSWKQVPVDNVWVQKYNQTKIYDFVEAVLSHRETHHPTVFNQPNAPLTAMVELDMRAEKKNRYIDNLNRICSIPYPFEDGHDRTVLAFAKTQALQAEAIKAGATLSGGTELIKDLQNGDLSIHDYQFVVAHPNIIPELVALRGILKRKFPNPKNNSLGVDLADLVRKFLTGIQYTANKDEYEQDYAAVNATIGTLNMEISHLEENFKALLLDLQSVKPRRQEPFITRCYLLSAPSREKFTVKYNHYIETSTGENQNNEEVDKADDEEVEEKVAVKN